MRRIPRRRLKRLANDLGDLVIADLARRAGTPARHRGPPSDVRRTAAAIYRTVASAAPTRRLMALFSSFGGQKNDARPLGQPLVRLAPPRQALKCALLARRQVDRNSRLPIAVTPPANARKRIALYSSIRRLELAGDMSLCSKTSRSWSIRSTILAAG